MTPQDAHRAKMAEKKTQRAAWSRNRSWPNYQPVQRHISPWEKRKMRAA